MLYVYCGLKVVLEAHYERREVNPGEALVVNADGTRSFSLPQPQKSKVCIHEHVYNSLPFSVNSGISVSEFRRDLGEILATESPVDCDVVIAVTESGAIPAYKGMRVIKAGAQLFPDVLLEKMGPTFSKISMDMMRRLNGMRVVVVEDSFVTAFNKSSSMVKLLEKAGAKQAPINGYCYYGVEVPDRELSAEELGPYDSVAFLS
ncbi:hypothetical protein AAC387_Pa06g0125 [Persea americana]